MLDYINPKPPLLPKAPAHRAFYHAVSKQRWLVYQKREYLYWSQQKDALSIRQDVVQRAYIPFLKMHFDTFDAAEDLQILELGCGAVCAAQYLKGGHKTYVDPLIDDFRRLFPAILPGKSTYFAHMAEDAELSGQQYDMVICLDTLSDVHNPELVLNTIVDHLKKDGLLMVSMDLWPSWLAKLHCFLSRFLPVLPGLNRLYSYTRHGFVNSLKRHFDIVAEYPMASSLHWLSLRQECLYVCKVANKGDVDD